MRKTLILVLLTLALAPAAVAQKYACVNTDYILKSMPDYTAAQRRLDKYVADWQKELQEKQDELDALHNEYEQESYLLPENLKKRRQEEIKAKEQEIRDLQMQRFGPGGDLDRRRAELLKPVQDRVYSTIERVAHEKNYAFVFDKAASNTVLFANKKYDISDEVLELMGINPNAAKQQEAPADDKPKAKRPTNNEMNTPGASRSRDVGTPLGGGVRKK